MSDVAISPVTQQPVSSRQDTAPDSSPSKSGTSAPAPATPPSVDTVSLSTAAQTSAVSQATGAALSESDAADQSAALRQQLPKFNLSGTAKQNQSILALLR